MIGWVRGRNLLGFWGMRSRPRMECQPLSAAGCVSRQESSWAAALRMEFQESGSSCSFGNSGWFIDRLFSSSESFPVSLSLALDSILPVERPGFVPQGWADMS